MGRGVSHANGSSLPALRVVHVLFIVQPTIKVKACCYGEGSFPCDRVLPASLEGGTCSLHSAAYNQSKGMLLWGGEFPMRPGPPCQP